MFGLVLHDAGALTPTYNGTACVLHSLGVQAKADVLVSTKWLRRGGEVKSQGNSRNGMRDWTG